MRFLAQAVHYPKPEHRDDLVAAMDRMRAASAGVPGLEQIGGFEDADGGRIIAVSIWSSLEALQAGMATLGGAIADVPFAEWERREHSLEFFPQVA
ncbi:antibiotic biosynthesis monooxygenase [Actinoplanes oblitus]|uniref:Antibiotic biosynthesis monooxygenase n=1 Tax=Actinoplanes oblitus TaxID=3040509 RepID=A0ABY8W5Q0_9ACTN|nr:antibiotic biosynthesis monooxygenase [Actinoplanes oblitus]WIM93145.1 antibiotic biosynthesis monooxygenase [Actinoplanes oblitus]